MTSSDTDAPQQKMTTKNVPRMATDDEPLSLREARIQAYIDAASDWLWEMDEDLRFTYFSDRVTEVTGVPVEFHIGKTREELAGEAATDEKWQHHLEDLRNHRPFRDFRFHRTGHDGRVQYLSTSGTPIHDENGTFKGYVGIGSDLTAQMEAEHAASLAQTRLANAIESLLAIFALWGPDDRLVLCNEAFRVLNEPVRHLLKAGLLFEDYIREGLKAGLFPEFEDDGEAFVADRLQKRANSGKPFVVLRQNGVWVRVREQNMPDGGIATIGIDITEIKKGEEELQHAKEAAEAANRSKTDFLSSMSHELRTPLNAILGFGQLLEVDENFGQNEFQTEAVQRILKSGNHLLELINQVLDLSRIESGNLLVSIEPISATVLVDDCFRMAEGAAARRQIQLHNRIDMDGLPMVQGDMVRARQVLLNILMNSVKYNNDGGQVWLSSEVRDGRLRMIVADNGPGISRDYQQDIFVPFNRLGMEGKGIEGTGIGLTISKQLIEMMKGAIGFEETEGGGATFWIELPLAKEKTATEQASFEADLDAAEQADGEHQAEPVRSILYVEDNPANMALMKRLVERMDKCEMVSAPTAEIGLSLALDQPPALVLMDINLPGINGIEALQKLRETETLKDIPVVAVTAAVMPKDVEEINGAGFDGYIAKPLNVKTTMDVIREKLSAAE